MKLRPSHLLNILACIYLAGGHWAVLQFVAWVGMLADYSCVYGARQAIIMTLDGNHPCDLCITIRVKKAEEQKQDAPLEPVSKVVKKIELLAETVQLLSPPMGFSLMDWLREETFAKTRMDSPPYPPSEPV